jgi:hypothetical protein
MCCQTRRRDDEEVLHRTITYKIGPYVRGITLHTPATSNYLNLPSKTKMLQNRFIQWQTTQPMKITKAHRSSPRKHNYEEGGGQIATSSPTYFINIYIQEESDRQENTFSLINLWKGENYPKTPPLITNSIYEQDGPTRKHIFPDKSRYKLILNSPYRKTLPNTLYMYFPFIKCHINVIGMHCSFAQWFYVVQHFLLLRRNCK